MPLIAVEPQRLYRQIAEQLRVGMLSGEFAVGSRLPAERDLAKQLSVSRSSVREALIALEVEGWVEVRTGSGYLAKKGKSCDHYGVVVTPYGMDPAWTQGNTDHP